MTTGRTTRTYLKRPRVGDVIACRVGPVTVTRVYANGVELDVVDRLGRDWHVERVPHGHWVRERAR